MFGSDAYATVTAIDGAQWQAELGMHDELFKKLEGFVPQELLSTRKVLGDRFAM